MSTDAMSATHKTMELSTELKTTDVADTESVSIPTNPEGVIVNTESTQTDSVTMAVVTNKRPIHKLSAIRKALNDTLNDVESNNSTICDIIAMYLKGQKILYTEAKTVCEQRLNFLMLPAIFITAVCTILSLVLREVSYGPTIVSALNGFNAFLLAVVNYLKLDAKAEAHRTSAYKFDKLQSYLEFNSGKILFFTDKSKELEDIITKTESAVQEIKETNQFILPESIRFAYPRSCTTNVFAEVKKLQNIELGLMNNLKDCMNEYNRLYNSMQDSSPSEVDSAIAHETLLKLETDQKNITDRIIKLKNQYYDIDNIFEDELSLQQKKLARRCQLFGWLKS